MWQKLEIKHLACYPDSICEVWAKWKLYMGNLHTETNEGQRKIGHPRKKFRQCLKKDFKSFNIPVEDLIKSLLTEKQMT